MSETDKLAEVESKIQDVMAVGRNNISLAIGRGESLDALQDKSEALSENAALFQRNSRDLRCHMVRKYWTHVAVITVIIVGALSLIIWGLSKD